MSEVELKKYSKLLIYNQNFQDYIQILQVYLEWKFPKSLTPSSSEESHVVCFVWLQIKNIEPFEVLKDKLKSLQVKTTLVAEHTLENNPLPLCCQLFSPPGRDLARPYATK